jgi:hypothetical protein
MVFRLVMLCSSGSLQLADILLGILDPEDGGDIFVRKVRGFPNYQDNHTVYSYRYENHKSDVESNNLL